MSSITTLCHYSKTPDPYGDRDFFANMEAGCATVPVVWLSRLREYGGVAEVGSRPGMIAVAGDYLRGWKIR